MRDITVSYARHDAFKSATRCFAKCDTTYSYVQHGTLTRLIYMWDITVSYARHDAFIYQAWWFIPTWDMPPKMREIALGPSTNLLIPDILVLAGSESTITEITGYKYFSLINPSREFKYKSKWKIVPLDVYIGLISLLWNIIFIFYHTHVQPQCDFSILGQTHS